MDEYHTSLSTDRFSVLAISRVCAVKLKDTISSLKLWRSIVKVIPVLGTLVLLGAIVQIVLGYQLAADVDAVRGIHMMFGIAGLILVIGLAAIAFRSKVATTYSKITISILTIVVLAQVAVGFQLLGGAEPLVVLHEATGFVIVLLSLLMGGITFWSAKRKAR